jgi:hypothetical protein
MLDGREGPQNAGVVQQAIQPAVTLEHGSGNLVIVRGERLLQIQQRDDRLGCAAGFDFRVDRFQLAGVAADEDHLRPMRGAGDRNRTAHAAACAGDGDDPAGELGRTCRVRAGIEGQSVILNANPKGT